MCVCVCVHMVTCIVTCMITCSNMSSFVLFRPISVRYDVKKHSYSIK